MDSLFRCLFYFRLFDVHSFHSAEAHVRFVRIAHATHTHEAIDDFYYYYSFSSNENLYTKKFVDSGWFHVMFSGHDTTHTHRQIHCDTFGLTLSELMNVKVVNYFNEKITTQHD